ncbi:DNA-processing protein DprA [Rugamonas sp.]|uniref:DNA-processing protein DprA n=1 Tax=Rugamonas sp. TaxID=1926287 RepID=UPI0025EF2AD7|nr:DNA-processing protein DprA [Rugamonas sp.]
MAATDTPTPANRPAAPDETLAGWLRLAHTPGVGLLTAHRLLAAHGTPAAIFGAGREALLALVKPAQAQALAAAAGADVGPALAGLRDWLGHPGRHLLTLDDPRYPPLLREIADAPLLLYAIGRVDLLARPAVAIVGSRNASAQGVAHAARFGAALSQAGLTIVSGLALGIDAAAHDGGLAGAGATVAVIATGADQIYPRANGALARRIAADGCVVSEFPLGTPPRSDNFPRRNRIISGLARGVLVVEAAAKSGSLITARLALDQNRDVYAIPGSIHAALSKGCHQLIKEGAKLVETVDDVLAELRWPLSGAPAVPDSGYVDVLLDAIGDDVAGADALALRLGLGVAQVQSQLLSLEMARLVERLPGGLFQRLRG